MSKTDELRAMREAKYARAAAALSGQPQAQPKTEPKKKTAAKPKTDPKTEPQAATDDGLCGHRSMNGRSCTREAGHAAKSHRYS
ncbi:hypothetical protein GCM10023350_51520 [Nocardioides endophyticus]|uniref:Uncharacterized protein n=1 Tax=Nocardioides endophyticus TaxID=1353775 RepID=A0ABP8ZKG5_9ACTN